ncbi:MAG: L-aspartate oxidase [Candidatus Lindowbacteria bacterium RIFCSPLOWO2_12_FULL_62_27]|nr:MAG: L-aspartate oxidase [Candidatus Lindowbacteria bacterium RIFCSPLOWO2_02_FULL_62_12]OGH62632.1 MAG: L-aspartate oxidase [Candidatus Lindowbacteria bacterium RIFCSPLOWO2_12_FULL_62_27]
MKRALISFDTAFLPERRVDALIVGGGVAGLTAALSAPARAEIFIACKGRTTEANTYFAQGGVAAALSRKDSVEQHEQDTIRAGAGLCDLSSVRVLTSEGPAAVEWLIRLGVPFDRRGGELAFTREGAHSAERVLHAAGDATGRVIQTYLLEKISGRPNIQLMPHHFLIDILVDRGRAVGGLFLSAGGVLTCVWARSVILASGGFARLFRESTNPPVATGDGLAAAYRAGATLSDVEFVQFHPTTLYLAGAPRFLISEAARGEGAVLRNEAGERFMPRYHPDAELAPRDVVARAILKEMRRTNATSVFLDLRPLRKKLSSRFPTIGGVLRAFGLDPHRRPIPVRPAAHYTMGGVRTDLSGRTDVPGLYAIGEVSSTGVHGANRLASNSLLEGLVFGRRAIQAALDEPRRRTPGRLKHVVAGAAGPDLDVEDVRISLRSLMSRNVGLERHAESLKEAEDRIRFWQRYSLGRQFRDPAGMELQNMLTLAGLVVHRALWRRESRGAHFRSDFPRPDDRRFKRHSAVRAPHSA